MEGWSGRLETPEGVGLNTGAAEVLAPAEDADPEGAKPLEVTMEGC